MRFNKSLSAGLALSLFLTASIHNPAMGQSKILKPQGAWALTKMDRISTNGNSYCTLSHRYDENIVLSLGRNIAEEYSLAFDFQKSTFEKDKSLKISLQPGPGQLRSYDLVPASEKALVIRLGWDKAFFNTLNDSNSLKLTVKDKTFDFKLSDIVQGQKDLEDCMDDLKQAAASSKINTASGGDEKSKDVLTADVGTSAKGFDAQKIINSDFSPVAAKIEVHKSIQKETDEAKKNFASKASEKQPQKQEKQELGKDQKIAIVDDSKQGINNTPSKKDVVLEQEPETNKMAAKDSNAAPSSKPDMVQKAPQTREEDKALLEKVAALEKSLKEEQAKAGTKISSLDAKLKETEIKKAQLEDTLRQSQTRIAETAINSETKFSRQISDLEAKLQAAQADNLKMAQQLDSIRLQKEDKAVNLIAGDWDLEKATKRFNESEREIQRLGLQIEKERSSCNMEKKQIEGMLFDPAVTEKAQIQKLASLEQEIDRLKKETPSQESLKEVATLKQSLVEQKKNFENLVSENEILKTKAQTLEASLKVEQGKGASVQTQTAAMTAQIEEMKKQVAEQAALKAENEALKAKTQTLEASLKVEQGKGAGVQTQTAAMTAQIEEMKKQVAEQAALKAENEALKAKAQTLEASLKVEQGKGAGVQTQTAAMNAQVEELKKQVAEQAALKAENEALKVKAQTLEASLKVEQGKGASVQTQTAAINLQIEELKKQVAAQAVQSTQLAKALEENAELKGLTSKLQADLLAAQTSSVRPDQVSSLQIQIDTLKQQIALKDAQNATYQNQLALAQREKKIAEANLAGFETRVARIAPASGVTKSQLIEKPLVVASAGEQIVRATLQKAGAALAGFSPVSKGLSGAENFVWAGDDGLKGFAATKPSAGSDFESNVDQYIAYQKSQCQGDFASMPSPSFGSASMKMSLYEIACVGASQSVSASLLLYEDKGQFFAIGNQTDAANMDIAMDGRDKIAQSLRGL